MDPDHEGRAFSFLDSVYRRFPGVQPSDVCRKLNYKRHYFYEIRKNYPAAMIYVDSLLTILKDLTEEKDLAIEYARALFDKGDILDAEGKHKNAFFYYYQGKQVVWRTGDTCLFGEYTGRLGGACYKQGLYDEARRYFNEAFDNMNYCGEEAGFVKFTYQQGNLDNMALCYAAKGNADSALYFYDSALHYIQGNGRRYLHDEEHAHFISTAKGVIYGNKGDISLMKGNVADAEALYKQSIAINIQRDGAHEDAQFAHVKLIKLYLKAGRFTEARGELERLRSSLDSLPSKDAELQWRKLRWRYSDSMHLASQAYSDLQSYIRLKDSMAAVDKPADINEELRHIADSYDLELLKKQDEIKSIYLWIIIIFFSMAIVIILQVVHNWRRSRKNVVELTTLNGQILVQNDHMQKTLHALEQSQRENTRMMKIVAHDLRNPIGAINSIAGLLAEKEDVPAEQRAMLELIRRSSQNSLELITDLLHVHTKAEDMKKELVDMESVLKYCVDLLRHKAEAKRQRLLLDTIPLMAPANREKMWRVISNLVSNAIKFSPEGTDIEVGMRREGDLLLISVKDQGIGIPEEMSAKLFDPFTEAKRRGTAGEESFGLGLSISRQIVEAHGGRLWYKAGQEKGTIFFIELPIEDRKKN